MKSLNQLINEKLKISKKSKSDKIVAEDHTHLIKLINNEKLKNGNECSLNHIDVSNITDFSFIFLGSRFDGDISEWDVSNAKNMHCMFARSKFTGKNTDFSDWNVNEVNNMKEMFANSKFNGDVSMWDINDNCNTKMMFHNCDIDPKFKPRDIEE